MGSMPYDAPPGFVRITRVDKATVDGNSLHAHVSTESGRRARVSFQLYARDIWHWTVLPEGSVEPPPTGIVCLTPGPALPLTVRETPTTLIVGGSDLTLSITRDPWSFCFANGSGRRVFRDNPGDVDGLGRPFVLPDGVRGR